MGAGDAEALGEDLLYVRPDRRHGRAAWKLVEAFVALARELGVIYARASVATGAHGAAAERLYERHGMHRVGGAYAIHF